MLPKEQARLIVILCRARNPQNIGAVARAMHDFGFQHLRVVNEFTIPFEAARSAVDASHVLAAATQFTTLADAVADCTLVLGTTAVGDRALEHPVHAIAAASDLVHAALTATSEARVALLFGSEKTGLTNDELSHCHALATIPMNASAPKHLSMNLGQAAAVCLYELARRQDLPRAQAESQPASSGDHERLTGLLLEVMEHSGYTRRHPANARETSVRRLVRRMAITSAEVPMWTGILRQILHAIIP